MVIRKSGSDKITKANAEQTLPLTKRIVCGVMNLSQYDTQKWLLAKMTAAFEKIGGTRTYKKE